MKPDFQELQAIRESGFFRLNSISIQDVSGHELAKINPRWLRGPTISLDGTNYEVRGKTLSLRIFPVLPSHQIRQEQIIGPSGECLLSAESPPRLLGAATTVAFDGKKYSLVGVPTKNHYELRNEAGEVIATVPGRGILTRTFHINVRQDAPMLVVLYMCCLNESL